MGAPVYDIVVPSVGRPSLGALLGVLADEIDALEGSIIVVDDRRGEPEDLAGSVPAVLASRTTVLANGGRGPAAARNMGWRASHAPWVVFLDDDVVPRPGWTRLLGRDLAAAPADVAAIQGMIRVPLPRARRTTDRERNVARLQSAKWITADLAVRRELLEQLDGFDERFPRAYREDTDLQLRAVAAGHRFIVGDRLTIHPVGPAPWWISVTAQRGNADDALLRALHGPAALDRGRRARHQLVTASALTTGVCAVAGRRRLTAVAAGAWAVGTVELAWARVRQGPGTLREVATMIVTSVAIPPMASAHWWWGRWRWRNAERASNVCDRHPPPARCATERSVPR